MAEQSGETEEEEVMGEGKFNWFGDSVTRASVVWNRKS